MAEKDLKDKLEKHRKEKEQLKEALRTRLKEIETERAGILKELSLLEGRTNLDGGNGVQRNHRLSRKIMEILKEAGPDGLDANDVYHAVRAEVPEVSRQNILTHLSRMKRKDRVKVEGEPGSFTYIALAN